MSSSQEIAESPAHLSITTWLEARDVSYAVRVDGADLYYEGATPQGPLTISALSPFNAEPDVVAICSPALVRAVVGDAKKEANAWAPAHWPGGGLAFYAASEDWCGGVLHARYDPIEQQNEDGYSMLTPPNPYIDRFLTRLGSMIDLGRKERRRMLAAACNRAATELGGELAGVRGFLLRTGQMLAWGGGGAAFAGGLAAVAGGLALPGAVPVAAGVGLVSGVVTKLVRAARAARVKLWPITRAALEELEASPLFSKATISPEAQRSWNTEVLLASTIRDMSYAVLRADNRLEAATSDGSVQVTVDAFSLSMDDDVSLHPLGVLVTPRWAVIRVRLSGGADAADLGRLERLPDSPELVGWMTEEDLGKGALEDEVLGPLALWAQQGRSGPYR